jgi:hypothetical protein
MERAAAVWVSRRISRTSATETLRSPAISMSVGVRPGADEPGDPVEVAEFVEDGAADAVGAVGLELDVAGGFEAIDGVHESEDARRGQVVDFDVLGEFGHQALGDEADDGEVLFDQGVLDLRVAGLGELFPEVGDVLLGELCRHQSWLHYEGGRWRVEPIL